jgi:hypothetical protein
MAWIDVTDVRCGSAGRRALPAALGACPAASRAVAITAA